MAASRPDAHYDALLLRLPHLWALIRFELPEHPEQVVVASRDSHELILLLRLCKSLAVVAPQDPTDVVGPRRVEAEAGCRLKVTEHIVRACEGVGLRMSAFGH